MDQAQRANAAQLAARNIKQAKPKSRRPAAGSVLGRGDSQTPQFAPMPGQNTGGLFGGSVQGGGSFNFAPPAGVPSFPPPAFGSQSQSFGTPSPDTSDNEGRFEGDNRATKRQFGASSTIQQSNSFSSFGQTQPTNPFASANQQQNSGGSIFSFGASQPLAPSGIDFNSSTPSNPFSFGATSSQPAPTSSNTSFGTAPVENKASNGAFNFGGQQNQSQGGSSIFNFNQPATQEKPASAPFQFGQTSTQTATSGINFNSAPATTTPSSSFSFGAAPATTSASPFKFQSAPAPASPVINFGSTPATTQTASTNIFGAITAPDALNTTSAMASTSQAPSPSLFSHLNTPAAPANNLFGNSKESTAPTTNIFGALSQPQTTNNIFGNSSQTSTTTNLFGEKKQESSSSNIFGQSNLKPSVSNIFGDKKAETTSSNLFQDTNKSTPSNFFGTQNQEPAKATNLFGTVSKESSPTNDLFGNLNRPVDPSVTQPNLNAPSDQPPSSPAKPTSLFNIAPASPFTQAKPLFAAPATTPAQSNGDDKPGISLSATPTATQSPPKNNIFSPLKPVDAPAAASQPPPSGMFPSLSQATPSLYKPIDASGLPPNHHMPATVREGDLMADLVATRKISDLELKAKVPGNFSTEDVQKFYATYRIASLNKAMQNIWAVVGVRDPTIAFNFYSEERDIILSHYSVALTQLKRKSSDNEEDPNSAKRPRPIDSTTLSESSNKRKVVDGDEENQSPNKKNRQFQSSSPAKSTPSGTLDINSHSAPLKSFSLDQNTTPQIPAPSITSPSKSKRKATEELTQNTEQLSPLRREMKTPKLNGASSSTPRSGSQTSNMFKSILESPSDSPSVKTSPEKSLASPEKPESEAPRFNPFGSLQIPKASLQSPPKSPPKVAAAPSNPFKPTMSPAPANPFSVKPSLIANTPASNTQNSSGIKMPTFGVNTNFMAQFGAQAKKSEEDDEAAKLQRAKDEDMDSDDDEAEFEAEWRKKRAAEKKELADIAKNGQKFQLGQAKSSSPLKNTTAKPPTKPLFGQSSSSEGSGNSVFNSLNGSRTSTPGPLGSSSGSVLDGHTPGKAMSFGNNIFGHLSDADSGKGDDGDDDSADGDSPADDDSETKDPSYKPQHELGSETPPEKTGAGIASAKKLNMFGLSSNSPSTSGSSSPAGSIFGRVSNDISKKQDDSAQGKDNGGTTTPGGSLFDRITKDSNGNPVRHISTEEKENTQPSSRNIFGDLKNPFSSSLTKSTPSDQTWKPDSPIKFGASSSGLSSAPTIDITSATPTKSGSPSNFFGASNTSGSSPQPFGNLFGSKPEAKPEVKPFGNLFGNPSGSKPASNVVGFGFGAASTPASLMPSATGSATTSRATTPGATTDGESGADADPDAERHEQIDLTAGGPGEEDEEVIHEIRTKALKFCPKEEGDSSNPWETKGLGPLRVLKHKETNVSRILMRADPSGSIVLNKGILGKVKYEASGKTLKLLAATDDGKGMETWVLQVKTPESAEKLAEILEAHKASS